MKANVTIVNKESSRFGFTETSFYIDSLPLNKCMQLSRMMEYGKRIYGRNIIELSFSKSGLKRIKLSELK